MGGAEMQAKMLLARLIALGRFDIHYVTRNVAPDAASSEKIEPTQPDAPTAEIPETQDTILRAPSNIEARYVTLDDSDRIDL